MTTLSILIPTYNRGPKLIRLLRAFEADLLRCGLSDRVEVIVSDNASTDETARLISEFRSSSMNVTFIRQTENIGAEENFLFLYRKAASEHVWFFSDDDLPLPGAATKILDCLSRHAPDILLFSFVQPPGSKHRTFDYEAEVEVVTEPDRIVRLVHSYEKITIFVMRKVEWTAALAEEIAPFIGNNFSFINLAYSILGLSKSPKVCVISEPLATCDAGFREIRFSPEIYRDYPEIFRHPFVLKHLPRYADEMADYCYCRCISLSLLVMAGVFSSHDIRIYREFVRMHPWRWRILGARPAMFLKMVMLKSHTTWIYRAAYLAYGALAELLPLRRRVRRGLRI